MASPGVGLVRWDTGTHKCGEFDLGQVKDLRAALKINKANVG
jgi:hypothetical protein